MPDMQAGYSPAAANRDTEGVYPPTSAAPGSPGNVVDQESRLSVQDTTGTSVAGIGAALPGGSVTDTIPWAGSGQAGGMTGPGLLQWSGYAVRNSLPQQYGYGPGSPDTEAVYGGQPGTAPVTPASPYPWVPTSTLLTQTLDTLAGGGSALVPGLGTPPPYRAPSSIAGSGASNKDTTLTDILGNQVAAMPLTGAAYAAVNIDTSYGGAPSAPSSLSTYTDTFASAAAATNYYASQAGIVPSSITMYNTTQSKALVSGTDFAVTSALTGQKTVAYVVLTAGTNFAAGNTVTMTYQYGSPQYYDSNLPAPQAQTVTDTLALTLVPAQLLAWGVTTAASALTVFDVTRNVALVYNTDYTVVTVTEPYTQGSTYTETPKTTYALLWKATSTTAKLGDVITVTYSYLTSVPGAPGLAGSTSWTDAIASFTATAFPLTHTGVVTPPAAMTVLDTTNGKALALNVDYTVTITGTGSTLAYSVSRITTSPNSTSGDHVSVTYATGNAQTWISGPVVPGDKGIFVPFSPPAGTIPVDYYLVKSSDLGTQYVPASGQPGLYGQPSPSDGGAEAGQPTYQSDVFTGAFNSASPNALTRTGVITPAGQLIVRNLTRTGADPLQPTGTVLIYGYDYTVTQTGAGPWATYSVQRVATSVNSANGDTISVSYWYNTMGTVPLTPVNDSVTTAARVGVLHNKDVATPPQGLIVYDTTISKALAYGLDFTAVATGVGPAEQVQITTIAGGPAGTGAADVLAVYYSYGIAMATVFAQGVPANWAPFPTPAGGQRLATQGVQLAIAAGNRAGLGPFSTWSDYVYPLNYNAPQAGSQASPNPGTGSLDPRNSINPIYKPDGTVKAGTGLGP